MARAGETTRLKTETAKHIAVETRVPKTIDVTSILKSCQALSLEMEMSKMLSQLMRIVLENAGVQRGVLLLDEDGRWIVEAEGQTNREEMFIFPNMLLTSKNFTGLLMENQIKISMDSKSRALDNFFVERLWRSLKYDKVYLKNYQTVKEAEKSIKNYFFFFNHERPHQPLSYKTPGDIH